MNDEVVLGYRQSHTGDIYLLEAVPSDEVVGDIARNGKKRYGIEMRSSNTCNQIGCTGA